MFQLNQDEAKTLISQIAISSWGGLRRAPYAFTEQGIAMLSGVLNSTKAIEINIQIMREFVAMRHSLISKDDMENALAEKFDQQFKAVIDAFYELLEKRAPILSIGNNSSNTVIRIGNVSVDESNIWPNEVLILIKKLLEELHQLKLPAKEQKIILKNKGNVKTLLQERKPARSRLKEYLTTIKMTVELVAGGNSVAQIVLERIHQILKLVG
jgi:hypothetical protein